MASQHVRELLQLRDKYASVIGDERDDDDAGAIVELAIFFHEYSRMLHPMPSRAFRR